MSFEILIHDDLSLVDLVEISKNGGVVLKTPHIGNIYPNNLLVISLGIPTLFYDRTLGSKDANFHPDKIILGGTYTSVADPNILSTHATVTTVPDALNNFVKSNDVGVGTKLTDLHMSSIRHISPSGNCFTYSEYIGKNRELIFSILREVTEIKPGLWTRRVNTDGKTFLCHIKNWDDALKHKIFGITCDTEGLIIPNPVNILFHGIIDTLSSGTKDIYLLSGPDMHRYIKSYSDDLSSLFAYIRERLHLNIPEQIHCHIIPVSDARFVIDINEKTVLDEILITYQGYKSVENEIDSVMRNAGSRHVREVLIGKKETIKNNIKDIFRKNIDILRKTIFYKIKDANCLTQYDLLTGTSLYIHPWGVNSKLHDVSQAYKFLSRLFSVVETSREVMPKLDIKI